MFDSDEITFIKNALERDEIGRESSKTAGTSP